MPEARVIKYLKLPFSFDADRLKVEVRGMREVEWQRHYQILHYEGEWTALPLRSIEGRADDVIVSPVAASFYEDTVFLSRSPYLKEVLATFQCPLRAVRLMRLNASSIIKEHTDAELYFETGEARIHVPIITHPDVEFIVDRERVRLEEGQCWYINFNLPHSVCNGENLLDSSSLGWDDGQRLYGLLDIMKAFNSGHFAVLTHCLAMSEATLHVASKIQESGGGEYVPDEQRQKVTRDVRSAIEFCEKHRLPDSALKNTIVLQRLTDGKPIDVSTMETELRKMQESMWIEAGKYQFLMVEPALASFIDRADLFGLGVTTAFPSAQADLTQAGNCLAADCNTAAVFHLMRAAEIALRALAKDRGVSYPSSSIDEQQCGTLIASLDAKLNQLRGANKALWPSEAVKNEQIRFYHAATIELRSFNEAWRKHVCHAGGDSFYDHHQAASVMVHVRNFMQMLSAKISEHTATPEYWT